MEKTVIEFKGSNFTLPVVHILSNDTAKIKNELVKKIEQMSSLLKDAPIVINVNQLNSLDNLHEIIRCFLDINLHIVGVSGCQTIEFKNKVISLDLPVLSEGKNVAKSISKVSPGPLFINTPVRSGQQIYAQNRDLVINSLVSTGAEVIADGSIFIYGTLRGKALAGASGDSNAQIYCSQLEAELISIAGQYWLSDNIPEKFNNQFVRIYLDGQTLVIHELDHKGSR